MIVAVTQVYPLPAKSMQHGSIQAQCLWESESLEERAAAVWQTLKPELDYQACKLEFKLRELISCFCCVHMHTIYTSLEAEAVASSGTLNRK